jgi:hypothetical protein
VPERFFEGTGREKSADDREAGKRSRKEQDFICETDFFPQERDKIYRFSPMTRGKNKKDMPERVYLRKSIDKVLTTIFTNDNI